VLVAAGPLARNMPLFDQAPVCTGVGSRRRINTDISLFASTTRLCIQALSISSHLPVLLPYRAQNDISSVAATYSPHHPPLRLLDLLPVLQTTAIVRTICPFAYGTPSTRASHFRCRARGLPGGILTYFLYVRDVPPRRWCYRTGRTTVADAPTTSNHTLPTATYNTWTHSGVWFRLYVIGTKTYVRRNCHCLNFTHLPVPLFVPLWNTLPG